MKKLFLNLATVLCVYVAFGQKKIENIIIITTDGFRWQEVFHGMDPAIAHNEKFNQDDSAYIFSTYWSRSPAERRQKLLPFLWNVVSKQGQIYGNRSLGNKVDNANRYWFSYPGYNEIMTGYPDTLINSNDFPPNPNETILEFLNKQRTFHGKVAAFGAWNAFDRILNEQRSGIPVFSAFDSIGGKKPTERERLINAMLHDSNKPWLEGECLDVFTHYAAMEWLKTRKPKVLYIAYGETDEWAHAGMYRSYLDAAHQVDAWISEIWNFVQSDRRYRDKTALFIAVDHGRGDMIKKQWTDHGNSIVDAHEIWFAVMGPGIDPTGEMKGPMQVYQKQFAQTIARILGLTFTSNHPVADAVPSVVK